MSEEETRRYKGGEPLSVGTEAIVAVVVLLAIFLLGVVADPFGPAGYLVFVPFAALVAAYLLAFRGLLRRLT